MSVCLHREAWSQQVSSEQKQLAEDSVQAHTSLQAARAAELAARKAALEFEARAKLGLKEVCQSIGKLSAELCLF